MSLEDLDAMSKVFGGNFRRDPSHAELFKEYSNYKTEQLESIMKRFGDVRDQATKRTNAARDVLAFRSHDNHEKPEAQVIKPVSDISLAPFKGGW